MTPPPPPPPRAEAASPPDPAALRRRLAAAGQDHVLAFLDRLDSEGQRGLLAQAAALDIEALPGLTSRYVKSRPRFPLPQDIQPAPYLSRDGRGWDRAAAAARGRAMIGAGKVAAFTVAGGQGSRLGFEGPKGCYPAGAVTRKPLFAVFADALLGARDRLGVRVPWYIMTSPLNHEATALFFKEHRHFGLDPASVMFFEQGVMPSFDAASGRILMSAPGRIATNPDGHGGSLKALHASGALDDMRRRGVEVVSYFQVDNPLVRVLDPVFIGLHADPALSSGEMSSKMVPKADAAEKVGVFCTAGSGPRKGRVEVVEYSDLPAELAGATGPDGSLLYSAGSIAVHALGVGFVERLNTDERFDLPYHRADKNVPCIDPRTGEPAHPTGNNGVKLERFVFDALQLCERSAVLETDRAEEFAPIKNASGADSPESCTRAQTLRAARWLEAAGVRVPRRPDGSPDCTLEISARTAAAPEELNPERLPSAIEPGASLAL